VIGDPEIGDLASFAIESRLDEELFGCWIPLGSDINLSINLLCECFEYMGENPCDDALLIRKYRYQPTSTRFAGFKIFGI